MISQNQTPYLKKNPIKITFLTQNHIQKIIDLSPLTQLIHY
jgi:hypothetical protein